MLSGVLIKVGAYGIIRFSTLLFVRYSGMMGEVILVMAVLTMFLGAVSAMGQKDLKRLLAYSSISQMGFILIGIGVGTEVGIAAAIFYMVNHGVIKSLLFLSAGAAIHASDEREIQKMKLAGRVPLLNWAFFVGFMALAGVPPFNGFFAKFYLFQALVVSDHWELAALAFIAACITLLYSMQTWMTMFMDEKQGKEVKLGVTYWIPLVSLVLGCALLGIFSEGILSGAQLAAAQISDPSLYISAVSPLPASGGGLP